MLTFVNFFGTFNTYNMDKLCDLYPILKFFSHDIRTTREASR